MAVALEDLYREIEPKYDMRLVTEGCFGKIIEWTHIIEEPEFINLLHGDELVFTSGIKYTSEEWLMDFLNRLIGAGAGGLVLSFHNGGAYPERIVEYCNQKRFPLFSAGWNTPYLDVMRLFASVLLRNEQRETNLNTALKNAIYYPDNEEAYVHHFERAGYYRNMYYIMAVLSCKTYETEAGNTRLHEIARELQYSSLKTVVDVEEDRLLVMAAEQSRDRVREAFEKFCGEDSGVYAGIGTEVFGLHALQESYERAMAAYQLTKTAIETNLLVYEDLGVYKVLSDLKHPELGQLFVREVLGPLLDYDDENESDYMEVLKAFFENDCSVLHTARAVYCHKNTMNYKVNKVKEILGYDIMSNENRTRIMVALYFLKMRA